jgi:hypothetical protein
MPILIDDVVHADVVQPLPAEIIDACNDALTTLSGRSHFRGLKLRFHMVRIDDLIVLQSSVTLERAQRLVEQLPAQPSATDLLHISLGNHREPSTIAHRWNGNNTVLFTSDITTCVR